MNDKLAKSFPESVRRLEQMAVLCERLGDLVFYGLGHGGAKCEKGAKVKRSAAMSVGALHLVP